MPADAPKSQLPWPSAPRSLGKRLRNWFLTGVLVAAPIALTLWIVWTVVEFIDNTVKPLLPRGWNPDTYLPFALPGVGVLIALIALTLLGALAANVVGAAAVAQGERLLGRLPLIRNLYSAIKQVTESLTPGHTNGFRDVVLVEYPRTGAWVVGFRGVPATGALERSLGAGFHAVYVPTTPNPTSGFLIYCREDEIRPTDLTFEDAAKLIVSAGLVLPPEDPPPPARSG